MIVKCDAWPVVLPDDDGIRLAGRPDRCFYCLARVGRPHARDCVCVLSLVAFDVLVLGVKAGTYAAHLPHGRRPSEWAFQLNGSSWCADNALELIVWDGGGPPGVIAALSEGRCSCHLLEFKFCRVADAGPFRHLPAGGKNQKGQGGGSGGGNGSSK